MKANCSLQYDRVVLHEIALLFVAASGEIGREFVDAGELFVTDLESSLQCAFDSLDCYTTENTKDVDEILAFLGRVGRSFKQRRRDIIAHRKASDVALAMREASKQLASS